MRTFLFAALAALAPAAAAHDADGLLVYSSRPPAAIEPLLQRYARETGVAVASVDAAEPALLARLASEGAGTPADLLLLMHAAPLVQAAARGQLAPLASAPLEAAVPAALRDPEGRWFALAQRARMLVHTTRRAPAAPLSSYEALADPPWRGRLCLGAARDVASRSLTALLLARSGAEQIEGVVQGWIANLAVPPLGDDAQLLQAIEAGNCDVGIVDASQALRRLSSEPAAPIALFAPNQAESGAQVEIAGAGVLAASPQRAQAQRLLEWLASGAVQAEFARLGLEDPVSPGLAPPPALAPWSGMRRDQIDVVQAGERQAEAAELMQRAGWK